MAKANAGATFQSSKLKKRKAKKAALAAT